MTEPAPGHFVRPWVSRYDNGWEAWVSEDEHGDFDAFACPAGATTVKRDAVEDTEAHGKDAALSRWNEKGATAAARTAAAGSKPLR